MNPRRNAMLLVGMTLAILVLAFSQNPAAAGHRMVKFASYEELQKFLVDKSVYCGGGTVPGPLTTDTIYALSSNSRTEAGASSSPSHSETNNQVQGVDELDTVKTDGNYIYTVNGSRVFIVRAYPASDAGVASIVPVNGTVIGLFVNGDKLAIFGQPIQSYIQPYLGLAMSSRLSYPYWGNSEATVWIYDIADRGNPAFRTALSVEGSYIGARMIGDFVYLISSQSIPYCQQDIQLPTPVVNQKVTIVSAQQIYHSDLQDYGQTFTNILGFDLTQDGQNASFESFMLGTSGTIYVSSQDLYLTSPTYNGEEATVIHRIRLDRETILYEATGQVPGMVFNQFSMDENGDYFRVATHAWNTGIVTFTVASPQPSPVTSTTPQEVSGPSSGVYVLTKDLRIIGRLEGLGQGEQFHSARFMGDRAYLVTFKKTDPLFVIDLQDPSSPRVLGELKVPGYSDYLQPYDENHLIGIGKDTEDMGSFAWYLGVKVTLFDVTDPQNPLEQGTYVIGDRGTQSPALMDHKAVLFDRDRNLLVIPVEVAKLPPDAYVGQWGNPVWQGAYVFSVSPDSGVQFRGGITHLDTGEVPDYMNSARWVNRSLYIDNVLYTISPNIVKMNSLSDLQEINTIRL